MLATIQIQDIPSCIPARATPSPGARLQLGGLQAIQAVLQRHSRVAQPAAALGQRQVDSHGSLVALALDVQPRKNLQRIHLTQDDTARSEGCAPLETPLDFKSTQSLIDFGGWLVKPLLIRRVVIFSLYCVFFGPNFSLTFSHF